MLGFKLNHVCKRGLWWIHAQKSSWHEKLLSFRQESGQRNLNMVAWNERWWWQENEKNILAPVCSAAKTWFLFLTKHYIWTGLYQRDFVGLVLNHFYNNPQIFKNYIILDWVKYTPRLRTIVLWCKTFRWITYPEIYTLIQIRWAWIIIKTFYKAVWGIERQWNLVDLRLVLIKKQSMEIYQQSDFPNMMEIYKIKMKPYIYHNVPIRSALPNRSTPKRICTLSWNNSAPTK